MAKYTVFPGKFVCHTCKGETGSVRLYESTKVITWMCNSKHVSRVSLETKKNKKDYDGK
jgi:hypothetical protein